MGWSLIQLVPVAESSETSRTSPALLKKDAGGDRDVESSSLHNNHSHLFAQQKQPVTRVDELKHRLKSLLAKYNGATEHPDVRDVVNELAALNPCTKNCAQSPLFQGEFYALTCPTFPGRLSPQEGQEDVIQYTLGRMSFNIFQPSKLTCTLRSVRNPVSVQGRTKDGAKQLGYPLVLDITIHTKDGDLPAVLINEAHCYEHAEIQNRIMVSFTGGTLLPAEQVRTDPHKLKLWSETFQGAYKKADEERSLMGWIYRFMLQILLGLVMPTDDESIKKHCFHFEMKRAPVGYLDVLYLDEDLRITKGNRGTIVVVERSTTTPTSSLTQQ